jgi:hypothetical protein
MIKVQENFNRYYNRYVDNPQYKDYKALLFRAGDALQSAEMNEIQEALKQDINHLASKFMINGEIVSGCKANVEVISTGTQNGNGDDLYNVSVSITEGMIFADGNFVRVEEGVVVKTDELLTESLFNFGAKIYYQIITDGDDPTLTDPAVETRNYGQQGAGRLKVTAQWMLEDDFQDLGDGNVFFPLFIVERGEIKPYHGKEEPVNPFEKDMIDIVAKYDRNANGNYLIEGYETEFLERVAVDDGTGQLVTSNLGPFRFSIADGSANVDGYNFEYDVTQQLDLEKLLDYELKQSEPIRYRGSGNRPVIKETVVRGSTADGLDSLANTDVVSIERVYTWDNMNETIDTLFVQGTDFTLSGNTINWALAGNEPSADQVYFVDYTYYYTEEQGSFYPTRHVPVRKVFRISGERIRYKEQMTHGSFQDSIDELPNQYQPVASVQRVYTWDEVNNTYGTIYTPYDPNTGIGDYKVSGDNIDWTPNGQEPASSSTYFVDYHYKYTEQYSQATGTITYTEDPNNEGRFMGDISDDMTGIYLYGFADDTDVNFDYDFVLQRVDAVFISATGRLGYVKGVPDEHDPRVPDTDKEMTLKIAEVRLRGDEDPEVELSSNRVFKMSDIQLLLDNIKQNEYNLTRMALQLNLSEQQPGATLKGQFVDTFENDDHRDKGLEMNEESDTYSRAMTIGGNLIMDIDWENFNLSTEIPLTEDQMTLEMPSTMNPTSILSQPHYTKNRQINEYLFRSPPSAKIYINPSVYRWITKTNYSTFVRQVQTATKGINSFRTIYRTFGTHRWHSVIRTTSRTTSVSRQILGTSVSRSESIQRSRAPAIIPRIRVKIWSNRGAYNGNEQVNVKFDGKIAATLGTDSNGTLNGSFVIPANIVSGSKRVTAEGVTSKVAGETIFRAEPLSRKVQTTITQWWRWVVRRQGIIWREADPVAQTFVLKKTIAIDRINIVFDVLPTTDVTCVICETTAGIPDKTKTLISKTMEPNDLEPVKTVQPFIFDNKVILTKGKEYAYIIICKDAVGRVQVAELGKKTKDTPHIWLTGQAYSIGVLFNSSNNSAWTPLQKEDMRFWMYSAEFDDHYDYVFEEQDVENATDLMLLANAKVYEGTSIQYLVELLDRIPSEVIPDHFIVNSYSQFPLIEEYTGRVRVTARMKSNGKFTPVLDPNIQLSVGTSKKTSFYYSLGFPVDANDDKIVAIIDNYRPANTTISLYIQVEGTDPNTGEPVKNWVQMTQDADSKPLDNSWIETKYELDLQDGGTNIMPSSQSITRIKILMSTSDDKNRPVISNLRLNTSKI